MKWPRHREPQARFGNTNDLERSDARLEVAADDICVATETAHDELVADHHDRGAPGVSSAAVSNRPADGRAPAR